MNDLLNAFSQKAAEMGCSQLAQICPNILWERFTCLIDSGPAVHCKTLATELCSSALTECPKVWLKQYALPIAVTAAVITATFMCCKARR